MNIEIPCLSYNDEFTDFEARLWACDLDEAMNLYNADSPRLGSAASWAQVSLRHIAYTCLIEDGHLYCPVDLDGIWPRCESAYDDDIPF